MEQFFHLEFENFLSPPILFFILGFIATLLRADISFPQGFGKGLSYFLLIAIGFKGGTTLADHSEGVLAAIAAGIALGLVLPVIAFGLLRSTTGLNTANASALSAHYGSISVVTFVTAIDFLNAQGIPYEGFMVAVMAIMESPGIIAGLVLYLMYKKDKPGRRQETGGIGTISRTVLLHASTVLLLGGFVIGWICGKEGLDDVAPLFVDPFKGVLCLFLLDIGASAARTLREAHGLDARVLGFGIYMPLIGGTLGALMGELIGLSVGGTALLAVLSASASYIAAPAAMRMAIPESTPAIYITMSLAVTFPFNVLIGIPLYTEMAVLADFWWGGP